MEDLLDLTRRAEARHGLVTFGDLERAGLSRWTVARWSRAGLLRDVAHGVYRIGGAPASTEAEILAAVLVHGEGTWASHRTAAWLWGVPGLGRPGRVDLTRRHEASNERSAARVHRSTRMADHHHTTLRGIPVTTLARTAFDLGRTLGPGTFDRVVEACLRTRHCTIGSLYRVFEDLAGRGRPGTVAMRRVLEARGIDYVPTESELDLLGRAVLASVPGIEWQVELSDERGYIRRVDGVHRGASLVIEWDGAAYHDDPAQRRLDAEHDRRLAALGYRVERFRWADVTRRPAEVRRRVNGHLGPRSGGGSASAAAPGVTSPQRPEQAAAA